MESNQGLITVPANHTFEVPAIIATCPYCNASLYASCDSWTESDDGDGWIADSIDVECESEPEMGTDEWYKWIDVHSQMPYVYQLPVNEKIEQWINTHFKFDLDS